jgi:hypothetical protein
MHGRREEYVLEGKGGNEKASSLQIGSLVGMRSVNDWTNQNARPENS